VCVCVCVQRAERGKNASSEEGSEDEAGPSSAAGGASTGTYGVAVCCKVLQYVAVCCSVLRYSVLQVLLQRRVVPLPVHMSLQCVAVICVAVCGRSFFGGGWFLY